MNVRDTFNKMMEEAGFNTVELIGNEKLIDDLDIDSTELVEISVAIENHFGISSNYRELLPCLTINDLIEFIEVRMNLTKEV
ncbi:acyl carrier protein [Paenibacillus sp. NPDC055715]